MDRRSASLADAFSEIAKSPSNFAEAVEIAKEWFVPNEAVVNAGSVSADPTKEVPGWLYAITAWHHVYVSDAEQAERADRDPPARLIEAAANDADVFEALKRRIALAVEMGHELRPEVRAWLADFLRGGIAPPKKPSGRRPADRWHSTVFLAVAMLVFGGMKATRNDASDATSACDAVAQALSEMGYEPATFHGVKRIWLQRQRAYKHSSSGASRN